MENADWLPILARNHLQTQCDYRAAAVRVEEFAEPVAFFQADEMERENVIQTLDANLDVQHDEAWWTAMLVTMTSTGNFVHVIEVFFL